MRRLIAAIIVVALLAAGGGAALFLGDQPTPGGPDDVTTGTPFPTGTVYDGGSGANMPTGTADRPAPPPFSFTVDSIEECGATCRDVTVTLSNERDTAATGISVGTRIFAGRNNTDPDDVVWSTEVEVGTLEAGRSHTTTERVELSAGEALRIQQRDGWITILTSVRADGGTVTFKDTEQVS